MSVGQKNFLGEELKTSKILNYDLNNEGLKNSIVNGNNGF